MEGKGPKIRGRSGGIKLSHTGIIQLLGRGPAWELSRLSIACDTFWCDPPPGNEFTLWDSFLYQSDFEPWQRKAIKMPAKLFQGC